MKGFPMPETEPIEPTDLERVLLAVEKCVIVSSGPGKMLFMLMADELRLEINSAIKELETTGELTPPKRPFIERLMDRWT